MAEGTTHLCANDTAFVGIVAKAGPCTMRPREGGRSHFEAIARSIVYQQLAGRAAEVIWGRVRVALGGEVSQITVLQATEDQLRQAGLSSAKTRSLVDLAVHVEGRQVRLDRIARLEDEAVIETLSGVRGIGRWTAQMFLMFQLGRLDVWPAGDLGVRNGYSRLQGLTELPTVGELAAAGERYAPYRSIAAWYCWRAADVRTPTPNP